MKYETSILKRLIDTYGVVGNPRYISEIIKEFIVRGKERFPELFAYQADWLAHIDEFGLNPSYTVSYTGQSIYAPNTLERPVKRAILKGQTLVNLLDRNSMTPSGVNYTFDNGVYTINTTGTWCKMIFTPDLVQNKKYFVMISTPISDAIIFYRDTTGNATRICTVGQCPFIFTNPIDNLASVSIEFPSKITNGTVSHPMIIEYQDGMENWNIPYFEGMQSVQMPVLTTNGKNLIFVGRGYNNTVTTNGITITRDAVNQTITLNGTATQDNTSQTLENLFYHEIKKDERYALSCYLVSGTADRVAFRVHEKKWSDSMSCDLNNPKYRTFDNDTVFNDCSFRVDSGATFNNAVIKVMFERIDVNSNTTSYEPYKSNILTVNEPVELRGIGDVQDELNLITGEVTQRIGEIALDGSLVWSSNTNWSMGDYYACYTKSVQNKKVGVINLKSPNYQTGRILNNNVAMSEFISGESNTNVFYIAIAKSKLTLDEKNDYKKSFLEYLNNNPVTVQYELAQESVKTVDLTILDQNGQNVKQLMSFNGGTHFNTRSSEGSLLPTVSVSVETDLEETLMVCSLEGNTM